MKRALWALLLCCLPAATLRGQAKFGFSPKECEGLWYDYMLAYDEDDDLEQKHQRQVLERHLATLNRCRDWALSGDYSKLSPGEVLFVDETASMWAAWTGSPMFPPPAKGGCEPSLSQESATFSWGFFIGVIACYWLYRYMEKTRPRWFPSTGAPDEKSRS